MASRRLLDLSSFMHDKADEMLTRCKAGGIDLLITCTYRSNEEQAALYAQGRTAPGKIVTNAKPGQSAHNVFSGTFPAAEAFDVVPLRNGKPVWDSQDRVWKIVGQLGKDLGLEWAGDWKKFKEYPHFQNPNWRK